MSETVVSGQGGVPLMMGWIVDGTGTIIGLTSPNGAKHYFNTTTSPGDSDTFTGLTDAPSSYTGAASKSVRVNAAGSAVEFYTPVPAKYSTDATAGALSVAAATVANANLCVLERTGAPSAGVADTLPTVAALAAAITNPIVGMTYVLRWVNSFSTANTITVTTNTGWTLNGTMTVAQNTSRDFLLTLTSLTAATLQSLGSGTN